MFDKTLSTKKRWYLPFSYHLCSITVCGGFLFVRTPLCLPWWSGFIPAAQLEASSEFQRGRQSTRRAFKHKFPKTVSLIWVFSRVASLAFMVACLFIISSAFSLLFFVFMDRGCCEISGHIKCYKCPLSSPKTKGRAMSNPLVKRAWGAVLDDIR